jgi:hypothetical protein
MIVTSGSGSIQSIIYLAAIHVSTRRSRGRRIDGANCWVRARSPAPADHHTPPMAIGRSSRHLAVLNLVANNAILYQNITSPTHVYRVQLQAGAVFAASAAA